MGTQGISCVLLYIWRSENHMALVYKRLVNKQESKTANRNGILGSKSSGLGTQSAAESPGRCT
jgi:hypothetical protein